MFYSSASESLSKPAYELETLDCFEEADVGVGAGPAGEGAALTGLALVSLTLPTTVKSSSSFYK